MAPGKNLLLGKKKLNTATGYPLPASCSVSSLNEFLTDGNASFLRAARSGNVEKIIEHLKGNVDINTSNANGLNALHLAAKEGHVNVVTELLKRGANVNAATKKGNTALHIASLAGQEEVVRVLIQLGANVNVQSQNGFTPLYMAAQENHDSVVSFLLANGANQSLATEDGFTPLAVALQQGHDKVVAVLLENDTKGRVRLPALHIAAKKDDCKAATLLLQSDHNPDVTSKSGFTPLHIAAHYGNENIAKILLSKGADVNYAAKHQITPLHVASKWGKMNMVKLLLDNGGQIDSSTRDGLTPLHCAARSGHDQVVDLLLEKGAPFLAKTKNGLAPLHMASQGDHVDSARILLYHKAPVDDVTVDYLTALHVAAHCGHVKVAKLLLDRKADPNARALNGFTPLHIACKKNRIKVVELLLKHGASIEATTESGLTPLHVASFMGCMNIVIYLIQNGANPDVPTVRGETPLHLAARANQTDIIRILLRNGASVDARAREEQTPLHIAARLGNVDIVSLLLQHGAAVDAVTKDMYTALHIAAKEDQEEVALHLLDHGASLTSTTKKGFTPLHLAAKYGNIKVARLLIQKNAPVDAQGKNGVTPLHVAAHYDHVNVALLLLDKGASPHAMAKNGYTPLHIAAKKNQMDIAGTLLEYGAKTNSESKAGFTPLHLSSQEGHAEMSSLLIDNKADVNHKAINGLTPLHLCAQDDKVNVATILVKNGAEVGPQTKAGYTPLHVASHFGQINMVKFLLQNEANVHTTTSHGYTPLHQAAQQGHTLVVNYLLENQASPNVTTTQGQTPLSIAQRLGYISVVETLKVVTETTVTTTTTTVTEEKYKVVAPETMQETFMTDSEDEGGADFDEAAIFGKPTHATHVYLPYVEGQNFQMSEEAMLGDQSYGYLTADEMKSLGDDSLPIDVTKDEKHHDLMHSVKQFGAPMVEEDKLSPQHGTPVEGGFSEKFSPDNIDLGQVPIHAGRFSWADEYYYSSLPKGMLRSRFLVSFMVDARGGAMRGCRHSGVRVIIPPRKASMPMRITCRYLRKEKLIHPPPLMEGEACASRILEMGPVGARFLGPVIIEVPHFASTRGKEREITILRSDTGESWREHTLEASEEAVQDVLNESFEGEELSALEDLNTNRITRILTTDFPQYFAVVTRIRQEVHGVGPEGGMVSSTVVPQVQAIFPEGALTKKIRVGLQAQPIAPELVAKLLGNRVAVSPIVTVEPRRRKFHKPITLTIPVPQAATKGMINQYSGDAPTLRLLCSITGSTKSGGSSKAQWEDVTGSTPLTFVNDCVSFTTTVSARFWLMDCRQVNEVTRFATELYQEAVYVPFMSKFVIFAKRYDPYEAQLRVFCMTDDKEDKTLESQENFTEVAKSRDVEVLEGKLQYLEFAGNISPVTKSGEQLKLAFQAFHENRLPFTIRVKDPHIEPMGRIAFMKEPKAGRGEPPQIPICNLNVALPEITVTDSSGGVLEMVTLEKRYDFIREAGLSKPELIHRADLRLSDIAHGLDKDWILLAQQLDLSESDIDQIKSDSSCEQSEQALIMLRLWLQKSGAKATGNELEKGLRKINREDVITNCMFNVELVTDDVEKAVAKVHLDQSGFDVFKEELGSSREASMRRGASLDISYDEQDIMKEAESAAETSSETGSLFERDQISQALTDDKEAPHQFVEVSNTPPDNIEALFPKCKITSNGEKEMGDTLPKENVSNGRIDSPIDISSSDNAVNIMQEDPSAMVHETSSVKIHDFWPAQPCTISTKVSEVLPSNSEGQFSVTSESSNVPSLANQTVTVTTQEIILNDSSVPPSTSSVEGSKILVDTTDLGYFSLDKDPNVSPNPQCSDAKFDNIIVQSQTVADSLPQNGVGSQLVLEPESKPELSSENVPSCTINQVTVTSTTPKNNPSDSSLPLESIQPSPAGYESDLNNVCSPGSELTNDGNVVIVSVSNSDICTSEDSNSQDARIRRASKTPPPTPVDELDKDGVDVKVKETLFSPSSLQEKLKEDGLKESVEVDIKSQELAGIPARLTESETWPSLELDTSQVSISSLPDDEKSEPTTATASDAIVITTEPDKVTTHVENVDPDDEDLSPTKFKDLCSKKVSPTTTSKMLFNSKLSPSALLTPDKILPLQDLALSPVKEVSEIETKETCTSPPSEGQTTVKPNQLISTRKGFRTRKRLSPIHDRGRFEPKPIPPSRVDKGLSPIAVFTAGPSGVQKEESEYFVQTYDAPVMETPDRFCSKSTGMSPFQQVQKDSICLSSKVEQSTSPFSDLTLDTGIGTDPLSTADAALSPVVQSPSSRSTQTIQIEMLSAHTSPIDGTLSSLQDSNLSFCGSLKSDSLDDLSKTLGSPSSDVGDPPIDPATSSVRDFLQGHVADDDLSSSVSSRDPVVVPDDELNKMLVIESFRNVFATEPPFSIVGRKASKKEAGLKKKRSLPSDMTAEDRLFSLHEQLLSEESALESSTDSGVDLKETGHGATDASETSPLKKIAKRKQKIIEASLTQQSDDQPDEDLPLDDDPNLQEDVIKSEVGVSLGYIDPSSRILEEKSTLERPEKAIDRQRLEDVEKQLVFDVMEVEHVSSKPIPADIVKVDVSINERAPRDVSKDKIISDSEHVKEEMFVKTEAKFRVGDIDIPFDKSVSQERHSKSNLATPPGRKVTTSASSSKTPEYVRQIEEQLLGATTVRKLTSPSSDINRIYIQDIFVDSSNKIDYSVPSDTKLNGVDKGKSVVEKPIVPQKAPSFEYVQPSEIEPEIISREVVVTATRAGKEFLPYADITEEKTEVDDHGVTTRIVQTVTTRTTVHSTPETVHVEEGGLPTAASLSSDREKTHSPASPELSFAEKRDFFQKLSTVSSANTTPTHTQKSTSETTTSETFAADEDVDVYDTPDEQLSFQECLKFFEKTTDEPVPKPEIKDIKKEVWTVLGDEDGRDDSVSDVSDIEKERDVETMEEVCEKKRRRSTVSIDEHQQVSLPLYESKDVAETVFDSTKDAKVEVMVKTFVPGSEMLEICSVENIAHSPGGDRVEEVVTKTVLVTKGDEAADLKEGSSAETESKKDGGYLGDDVESRYSTVTTKIITRTVTKTGESDKPSSEEKPEIKETVVKAENKDGPSVEDSSSYYSSCYSGGSITKQIVDGTGEVVETTPEEAPEGEETVRKDGKDWQATEDRSSTVTEVITRTITKQVGDGEIYETTTEEAPEVKETVMKDDKDWQSTEDRSSTVTKVITRTVTKQVGDGEVVETTTEEAPEVKETVRKDGKDWQSTEDRSSTVTEVITRTVTKQVGDGEVVETTTEEAPEVKETVMKDGKDWQSTEDRSSTVTKVITRTVTKQVGDGEIVEITTEEAPEVQETGMKGDKDGQSTEDRSSTVTKVITRTISKQIGDGTGEFVELITEETPKVKETVIKAKDVMDMPSTEDGSSTVATKVITRTVTRQTGDETEELVRSSTEKAPEVKETVIRAKDAKDDGKGWSSTEDESSLTTKVITRTITKRTEDGIEELVESSTEDAKKLPDGGTESEETEIGAEDFKDGVEDRSSTVTTVITRTITKHTKDGTEEIEQSCTEEEPEVEEIKVKSKDDIKDTSLTEDGSSTVTTRIVTKQTEDFSKPTTEAEKAPDFEFVRTKRKECDVRGVKTDDKDKPFSGESKGKVESVALTEEKGEDGTKGTETKFFTDTKTQQKEDEDGSSTVTTRITTKRITVTKSGDRTDVEQTELAPEVKQELKDSVKEKDDDVEDGSSTVTKVVTRTVTVTKSGDGSEITETEFVPDIRSEELKDHKDRSLPKDPKEKPDVEKDKTKIRGTKLVSEGKDEDKSPSDTMEGKTETVTWTEEDGTEVKETKVVSDTRTEEDVEGGSSIVTKRVTTLYVTKTKPDGSEVKETRVFTQTSKDTTIGEGPELLFEDSKDGSLPKEKPDVEKDKSNIKETKLVSDDKDEDMLPSDTIEGKTETVTWTEEDGTKVKETKVVSETKTEEDNVEGGTSIVTRRVTTLYVTKTKPDGSEVKETRVFTHTSKDTTIGEGPELIFENSKDRSLPKEKPDVETDKTDIKETKLVSGDKDKSPSDAMDGKTETVTWTEEDGTKIKETKVISETRTEEEDVEGGTSIVTKRVTTLYVTKTKPDGSEVNETRVFTQTARNTTIGEGAKLLFEDGKDRSLPKEKLDVEKDKTDIKETKLVSGDKDEDISSSDTMEGKTETVTWTEEDGTKVKETKVVSETNTEENDVEGGSTIVTKRVTTLYVTKIKPDGSEVKETRVFTQTSKDTTIGEGPELSDEEVVKMFKTMTIKETGVDTDTSKDDTDGKVPELPSNEDVMKETFKTMTIKETGVGTKESKAKTDGKGPELLSEEDVMKETFKTMTIKETGVFPEESKDKTDEKGPELLSDEEFIKKTFKTMTESQPDTCQFDGAKSTTDAFKKNGADKVESKWQRESPDNMSVAKETMAPSLGKSEIFICTEETLDNVKKILSVADAESNVVVRGEGASTSAMADEVEVSEEIVDKTSVSKTSDSKSSPTDEEPKSKDPEVFICCKKISSEVKKLMSEVDEINENLFTKEDSKASVDAPKSDVDEKSDAVEQVETRITMTKIPTTVITTKVLQTTIESFSSMMSDDVDSSGTKASDAQRSQSPEAVEMSKQNLLQRSISKASSDSSKATDIEALRLDIQRSREAAGIQFEESFARSAGSAEEKSFSSSKDQSVDIEFVPVLEVSNDVSDVPVDMTGHEALGTPCSFHKEADDVEDRVEDIEKSFEERKNLLSEFEKKAETVEKAEFEGVEKAGDQSSLEEIIYKKSIRGESSGGKETVQSVQVTQFKEHFTEMYNVPSEKLKEKFSSKKIHIESDGKEKASTTTQKLNQFLDSVTQQDEGVVLPSDMAPVLQRTEEWLDQSGELMREGVMMDSAEGIFEAPTLDDEPLKRSSPTAESFDDKARVEQCDTDVMMQLLDFVSRNEIELAEVRTEDEAPDIEEDVSPSAEEEVRVGFDEPPQKECLKVVDSDDLELSPQRSSFDSVTSPSRNNNVETVVDAKLQGLQRTMHPQSSLEVEVGSHDDEDMGTRSPNKEIVQLSFVEEEMSVARGDVMSGETKVLETPALPKSEPTAEVQKLETEKQPLTEVTSISQDKGTPIEAKVIGMASDVSESIKELTHATEVKSMEGHVLPDTEGKVTVVTKTVEVVSGPETETSKERMVTLRQEQITTTTDGGGLVSRHETESSSHDLDHEAKFVPCAFDNSAFAGAELIDQFEQSGPVRARSPYEVVREDFQELPGEAKTTYVTKHVEVIRRRPLLQNIPSEISEEDLVEREIVSPVSKHDPESFDLDVEASGETKMISKEFDLGEMTREGVPGETRTTTTRTDEDGTETKTSEHVTTEKVRTDSGYTVTRTVVTRTRQTVGHSVDGSVIPRDVSVEDISSAFDSHREDLRTQRSKETDVASEGRGTDAGSTSTRQIGEGAICKSSLTTTRVVSDVDRPSMNGPGEVDYHPEYDAADEYGGAKWSDAETGYERSSLEISDDVKKSRYSSVSDDVIDSEIRDIISSDQQFEDIIERPTTPEPPIEGEYDVAAREGLDLDLHEHDPYYDDGEHAISSPVLSPDDPKAGFAYGMQFEKEEAMDMDSDPYSEEKEPVFGYGMRFERDPDLEEDIPCYGDLYTHVEEDEDALENGEKKFVPRAAASNNGKADFDILAGRKFFSRNVDVDELSMSSLQEFERLEAEIVSGGGRKSSVGSADSLNGKIPTSKSGEHDDVSMSSLTEFERLEKECIEGGGDSKIDPAMQESITQLSEIEEGHESQASEPSNEHKSSKEEDLSVIEEYDHHLGDITSQILIGQDRPTDASSQKTTVTKVMTTVVKTSSGFSKFDEDMDQDSLHDELSLKPDSLIEEKQEYIDSLHEGKGDDADSLQGMPDEMRDSLFEDRHLEDDSLHEMDVLPDESSLSMESSFAAGMSHDSSKADDQGRRKVDVIKFTDLGTNVITVSKDHKTEIIVTDLPRDVMLSSTDSLEQSSSAAAAFHLESESMISSSLAQEDSTMVSSTDTLGHEGRITFRYEDIPVDELEILVKDGRKVVVDSEGNIQTEYDVKHFLTDTEENINYEYTTKETTETTTAKVQLSGETGYSSFGTEEAEPQVEVEEIITTDEFGNPKRIRKIRKTITSTQYSSSSSSDNVEEKMKEFLRREHAGGAGGEEVVEEERSLDEKGNVVLVRTVRQQMVSQPEVHSRTFSGPEAELMSRQFVERFEGEPTDEVCEFEKVDDEGNVVRVTQQVVIKPEVHSVSFSGPNARQEMEEYMRKFAAASSGEGVRVVTQQRQEFMPSESSSHETVSGTQFVKTTVSSLLPEASEQVVQSTITTTYSVDESGKPIESTDQTSSSIQ